MLHRTTAYFTETMPLVLLLLLLLLLSSAASPQSTLERSEERSDPLHSITADFSPKDPLFASGSTMELNGTLILTNTTPPGITAHQVQCKYDTDNLTVIVLDNSTFQIRRENVMRHMTLGHVFCHLNVMGTLVKFAQVSIRVADVPVPPNITGCVVYNWERMVCTWELPKQDTGLNTTYTLGWTVLGSVFHHCPIPKETSCEWLSTGTDAVRMDMPYRMKMIASNALGNVTSETFYFNSSDLVKPNPVKDLISNTVTSQSVGLSWAWGSKEDDNTRHLLYRVNYKSHWDNRSLETTNKSAVLSDLVPDTEYEISVECFPYTHDGGKGFWSETTSIRVSTDEDVPGRAPALADGSYSPMKRTTSAGRYVEVFWQPVHKRWLHGKLRQFRIRCFNYWNRSHVFVDKSVSGTYSDVHVADGLDMAVTVEAETAKGYNDSLDLKVLVIPRTGLAPAKPGMVHAVKNVSEITVMWSSVANASGYTVYWCKKAAIGHCETFLTWTSVSPDITSWIIPISNSKHGADFLVAVSTEMYVAALEQNISSGMLLAECVPDAAKPVKPPESLAPAKEQQAFSLTVEWVKPRCEDTAYIVQFEILYCQLQGCTGDDECCNNKSMRVGNNETKAVIRNLEADVEYEVSMRSISFTKTSATSAPIRHTVFRSGLTGGQVAAIVIGSLVLFLFLVVGLLTIAKKIKKCFYCCEKIDIITPPSAVRMLNEPAESDQVQYYRNGHSAQTEVEEEKTLLHDGKTSQQDAWTEDSIVIQRNGDDYRHPNMSKSFPPLIGDNGVHKRIRDESTDSGVGPSNTDSGVPLLNPDSGISTYTHLAVPDETDHSAHKQPNGSVASGRVATPPSDLASSHVLPRIATDPPPSPDVVEPPVAAAVTESYMPVEKIAPPVGSASSSTITPYTTVDMAELKNFPESRGCVPSDTVRQVETPDANGRSTQPDDYQQVRCPIDDYISGSLASVSNKSPVDAADNGECGAVDVVVKPLYANHDPPKSEDGYSDQHDIAVGTYSANNPLLPVGYIPLAPTLST